MTGSAGDDYGKMGFCHMKKRHRNDQWEGKEKASAVDRSVFLIQKKVAAKQLEVGGKLPSIGELAKELEVSSTTVREALQKLETMGLVSMKQGAGTFIAKPDVEGTVESLFAFALTDDGLRSELLGLKTDLEVLAVHETACRATDQELGLLAHKAGQMESLLALGERQKVLLLDTEIQNDIVSIKGGDLYAKTLGVLQKFVSLMQEEQVPAAEQLFKLVTSRQAMVEALRQRNAPKACELMRKHSELLTGQEVVPNLVIYCDILGTGSMGGSYYLLGQSISDAIYAYTQVKPSVEATGGAIENIRRIEEGTIGLGIVQASTAVDAYHGRGLFDRKHRRIRYVCSLPASELQVFTLASSDIQQIEDLRGKRIAVGHAQGGSPSISNKVLSSYGYAHDDYESLHLSFISALSMLKERAVDVIFFLSAGTSPSLVEFSLSERIRFLPLKEQVIQRLTRENEFLYPSAIKENTYPNQNDPVPTVEIPTLLIANENILEQDIYALYCAINARTKFATSISAKGMTIPHHPGMRRFFLEQG